MAVIYEAHFDEAGTQDDAYLVVAGFIAQAEEWQRFNNEWLELMGSEHAARSFKAINCKDESLAERAADLVRLRTACGFAVSICPEEYNGATSSRFRSQHGSAYTMCLKEATAKVGAWADMGNIDTPIAYFFDAGHRNQEQANQYLSAVYQSNPIQRERIRLGSWSFTDDSLVWPLKAADLLAYHFYQARHHGIKTAAMETLDRNITHPIIGRHLIKEDFALLVDQLQRLYDRRGLIRSLS